MGPYVELSKYYIMLTSPTFVAMSTDVANNIFLRLAPIYDAVTYRWH